MFIKNVIVRRRILSTNAITVIFLALAFGLIPTLSSAGTLTSTVDRNQISLSETLGLTISYDEQVDSSSLDLSVLNNDFEVLRSSPQSANTVAMVNGKTTRQASTTWTILLAPKKTGALTIPSFSIGKDSAKAIAIKVSDGAKVNSSNKSLAVWVSANRETVYPAQQLIVEIEISAQANIADLNGPQLILNNADVESLGQQTFQRVDNGTARQIVVLKYAVFPKQAGELIVPIMTYTGIQGGRRSIFGSSGSQVVARTAQLTIKVAEQPKSDTVPFNSAPWFPADWVSIDSLWSGDKNAIKVGEPITRSITISARGQRANIIPPIVRPSQSSAYKSYKDQPQLDSKAYTNGFIGTRTESEAIVAAKAGKLALPALDVNWWDANKQQWQTTTLPAETLEILAGASPSTNPSINPNNNPPATDNQIAPTESSSQSMISSASEGSNRIWQALVALLFLVCTIQAWFLFRLTRAQTQSQNDSRNINDSETHAWRALKNATDTGDAIVFRQTLLMWARAALPTTKSVTLRTLVMQAESDELARQIEQLETSLYKTSTNSDVSFDPKRLIESLTPLREKLISNVKAQVVTGTLPSLYPS